MMRMLQYGGLEVLAGKKTRAAKDEYHPLEEKKFEAKKQKEKPCTKA